MLTLYPDQHEVMNELRAAMRRKKAVLLQSPTGSGKTAMATDMVIRAVGKGRKMLFSVPRRDLMDQTSKTFIKHKIHHGFVAAGRDYNPFSQVYIGMVDTMARRLDRLPKVQLAVFDETHYGADALGRVIDHYKKMGAWCIGLSATPWKLNGQGLGIWYDEMIQGKSIRWLIDNKRLSDYKYFYGRPRGDFAAIRNKTEKEISEYMENQRMIIGDCVDDYIQRGMGRLWIVRCTSIKHSQLTAEAFRNAGINAMHVDGETPDDQKRAIFMAYARREILVLTFADLLNFGFDLSQATGLDVCVEGGSDQKPTKSLAGIMQFWGRMLRYKPYHALIHDHVNNYLQEGFGLPCSERNWTLDSKKKRDGGEKVPPTRQCPKCFYVHPPAPQCPECKHIYEIESREIKKVDGTLEEMDIEAFHARQRPPLDGLEEILPPINNEETLEYLIKYAQKLGKKNPVSWAAKELAERMNSTYNKLSNNGG